MVLSFVICFCTIFFFIIILYKTITFFFSKKSQVTEINFQFQKLCPCLKPVHHTKGKSVQRASVSVQCRHTRCCPRTRFNRKYNHNHYTYDENEETYGIGNVNESYRPRENSCVRPLRFNNDERILSSHHYINDNDRYPNYGSYNNDQSYNNDHSYNNDQNMSQNEHNNGTDEEDEKRYKRKEKSAIYQQLILNRNIQVFLQIEQFSKQKPIVLSRKQYNKVKRTIQKTICKKKSSHEKRKKYVCNKCERSEVSVGEVRKKRGKDTQFLIEEEAQTDLAPCAKENCRNSINKNKLNVKEYKSHKSSSKHTSTDQSDEHFSGDHYTVKSLTSERNSDRSRERNRSRSWKRGRSRGGCCSSKSKLKADQNIGVVTIDQFSANASWCSELSEDQNEKEMEGRIGERHNKRRAECNADRLSDMKGERGRKRNNDQKGERGQIYQKREQHSEQYNERGCSSPDQYSEQMECPSPGKIGGPNPERYRDQNKEYLINESDQNEDMNDTGRTDVERRDTEVKTLILYNADESKANSKNAKESDDDAPTRKTMSSVEIRYASVAYMKHIAYSSTDVGALSDSSIAHANSFHTIFRGVYGLKLN